MAGRWRHVNVLVRMLREVEVRFSVQWVQNTRRRFLVLFSFTAGWLLLGLG